jgi:hypothetical protein
LVVPAQFELPSGSFSEGRAWVKSEGLFGYIDPAGKLVIPAIYESAGAFSGGLARVRERGSRFFGYINTAGEQVIPPKFALADDFHEGVAAVQLGERWGYLNTRGEWVIPPRFDLARRFSGGWRRSHGAVHDRSLHEAFIDGSGADNRGRADYGAESFRASRFTGGTRAGPVFSTRPDARRSRQSSSGRCRSRPVSRRCAGREKVGLHKPRGQLL